MAYNRDPKTKSEILDRILRRDFDGDLTKLGQDGQAVLDRKGPNVLALRFPVSGEVFELTVHKRREQPMRRAALSRRSVEDRVQAVAGGGQPMQEEQPSPPRRGRPPGRKNRRAHA